MDDRTIEELNKSIILNPDDIQSYIARANKYMDDEEYDKAIADCDKIISLDAEYIPAYINRGNAYSLKNENDKAIADFSVAILIDPEDAWAYFSGETNISIRKNTKKQSRTTARPSSSITMILQKCMSFEEACISTKKITIALLWITPRLSNLAQKTRTYR